MSHFFNLRIHFFCTLVLGSLFFYSCDKDTSISLGRVDENIGVITVDTFSVHSSTYQLHYMPSTSTGVALIGKAAQNGIGSVISSTYTSLIIESINDIIPSDAVFDSINVVIKPNSNRYFYGDTTKTQSISVHRVTENITTQNILNAIDNFNVPIYVTGSTIFNNQKFNYDATPLGSASFNPYINSIDSVSIKLDNSLGQDLFNKMLSNDHQVSSNEQFMQYLKGIVIVPDNNNTVMLGMNDTLYMHLNYSYMGSDGFKKQGKKSMVTGPQTLQFNSIDYDRSGTPFATLDYNNRELNSTTTGGDLVLQSGTGLVAKLNIPSLNDFINEENIGINKVELIVETNGKNYGYYPIPNALMLLVANSNGVPNSFVMNPFSNSMQTATLIPGNETGVNPTYVFDLMGYIKNLDSPNYRGSSLLLAASTPALFNSINTAFIATENGKPKIKLNIVYTKFK